MKNNDKPFLIGIDPDVAKSGFCIYNRHTKQMHLFDHELWVVFDILKQMKVKIIVRLEAGHMEERFWQKKKGFGVAKSVGANNEIGRQIEKFCAVHDIPVELVKPCGLSNYDHAMFCKVTGWPIKDKTNPEKRVAGLLVYGF